MGRRLPSMFAGRSMLRPYGGDSDASARVVTLRLLATADSLRMTILIGWSKHAVAEERVDAGEGFGGVECGGAGRDAVRSERGLRGVRDRLLRERMRQGLKCGFVLEREMDAFIRLNEDEDARVCSGDYCTRRVIPSGVPRVLVVSLVYGGAGRSSRDLLLVVVANGNSRSLVARRGRGLARDDSLVAGGVEDDEMRIREARGMALPFGESRHVIAFAGHREVENRDSKMEIGEDNSKRDPSAG